MLVSLLDEHEYAFTNRVVFPVYRSGSASRYDIEPLVGARMPALGAAFGTAFGGS